MGSKPDKNVIRGCVDTLRKAGVLPAQQPQHHLSMHAFIRKFSTSSLTRTMQSMVHPGFLAIGTFQANSSVTSPESNSHSPLGYKQDQLESVTEEIVQVLSSKHDEAGFHCGVLDDGETSFCETLGAIACGNIAILAHNAPALSDLDISQQ